MATTFKRGGKSNRNGLYYIAWRDHNGKRKTKCSGTSDKAAAERIGAKLETDAALRREGAIDATLDAIGQQSRRSIESHLADYQAKLQAAGRDAKHVGSTLAYIRAVVHAAGFTSGADITADGANRYAEDLKGRGKSARTIQAYLTAVKGFTRWLAQHHKLPRDPLASVRKPDPKSDRKRERRMLLPEEWAWLRPVTAAGPERCGMTGAERAILYETAIQTGLRRGELESLTRGRLFLDADQPFLTCKAGSTKNKRVARQHIQAELAAALKVHAASKLPTAPVFGMPNGDTDAADMLRADLAEARLQWLKAAGSPDDRMAREQSDFLTCANHDGEVLDFHSLRHSCGAWLAQAGVHPKTVQTVMRHSSITLTMDTYGHLFPGSEADAIERMRDVMTTTPDALRATGTDGAGQPAWQDGKTRAQRHAQRAERGTVQFGADVCDGEDSLSQESETPNSFAIAGLGEAVQTDAMLSESSPGVTRTHNLLIQSQPEASRFPAKTAVSEERAARGAAPDADLALVIARWPGLPSEVKREILAMLAMSEATTSDCRHRS